MAEGSKDVWMDKRTDRQNQREGNLTVLILASFISPALLNKLVERFGMVMSLQDIVLIMLGKLKVGKMGWTDEESKR